VSDLLETLQELETELHQLATRCNTSRMEELLHPQFEEFGRSGRRYSRAEVLTEFTADTDYPRIVSMDFSVRTVGDGVALLTYRSAHRDESGDLHRHTIRSSVWVLRADGWQMLFHQGTPRST
jgi:hypothetical protein